MHEECYYFRELLSTYYECYYGLLLFNKQANVLKAIAKRFFHVLIEFVK